MSADTDGGNEKKSAATVLVELARERYTFGQSADGEPFATPIMGDPVTLLLRGGKRGLRSELARAYYAAHEKAAPQQALADALLVIEGMAREAEPEPLAQRVAATPGGWWIDLGDSSGDAIRVNGAGWTITAPPVKFRRTVLTAALPRPVAGGDLGELWALLNVAEPDRPLVLAWLVAAMLADIPHPILTLAGEQGTGKSTAARVLVSLLDPSPVPLRKSPRDADSWITAASGSWLVAIDNVSTIPEWLSDTLCRAVTGDGDVRRQLYTDGGLALFAFRRVILLNGIDLGAVRGDLADRLLCVDLDVIDDRARRLDADLAERWTEARARVHGALLDLAAGVAGVLASVRLDRSPRMADFARVLAAVDQVTGSGGLARYIDRARTLASDALSADPFVIAMAAQLAGPFTGTSAELLAAIEHGQDKAAPKGWPANARQLTTLLKRQAPVMRRAGWTILESADLHTKVLHWTVVRPEIAGNPCPQPPQHPQAPGSLGLLAGETAGVAGDVPAVLAPETRNEPPAITGRAGVAGTAGDEYGPSQDDDHEPDAREAPAGTPCCQMCGRPRLYSLATLARGICARCAQTLDAEHPEIDAREPEEETA